MKAYWINAAEQTVTAVEYTGLDDLHRMVGGYIECPKGWPTGDVLYVDEDGLSKPVQGWFRVIGKDTPIAGNGVVVGREIRDTANTHPPRITLEQLQREVKFLSNEQAQAWAKGNSSEPAIIFHTLGRGGRIESSEVQATMGEVFGVAPPTKPKK